MPIAATMTGFPGTISALTTGVMLLGSIEGADTEQWRTVIGSHGLARRRGARLTASRRYLLFS